MYCSLSSLLKEGVISTINRVDSSLYHCSLKVPDSVNPRDLKVDSEGNFIDYLMLSQSGLSWIPMQEVSIRVTMPPQVTRFNETAIMESDGGRVLQLEGSRLESDYIYTLGGLDLACRVLNRTCALCQMPQDLSPLLKISSGPHVLSIGYSNPVSMKQTVLASS